MDPNNMQLEEGHFQKEGDALENEFKEQFNQRQPAYQGGINADDADEGGEGGEAGDGKGGDGEQIEDFKYDDALAQEEQAELEELNTKLGSDFKTLNELKASLKTNDTKDEQVQIDKEKRYIGYFKDLLNENKYNDAQLIMEDKRVAAINDDQDPNDPAVIERINDEVETLTNSGMLQYAAKAIKDSLRSSLKEKEGVVNTYENGKQLSEKEKSDAFKQNLQEGLNEIFKQGKFLGIKPTKDDMLTIYKDISKNKHIEHLKANPKDAVEFALFKKYRDIITKNLDKPNFNAGVQNTLNELGMSNSEPGNTGGDTSNSGDSGELSFLQRFAK